MKRATRALLLALLSACTDGVSLETDTGTCGDWGYKPMPAQTIEERAVAWRVHPMKLPKGTTASVSFTIVNASDSDCPVAIYRDSFEPVLSQAPTLDAQSAPPSQLTPIGQLVDDQIVPRTYDEQPGEWFTEIPIDLTPERSAYLTVVGCSGLAIEGTANVRYDCADAMRTSTVD